MRSAALRITPASSDERQAEKQAAILAIHSLKSNSAQAFQLRKAGIFAVQLKCRIYKACRWNRDKIQRFPFATFSTLFPINIIIIDTYSNKLRSELFESFLSIRPIIPVIRLLWKNPVQWNEPVRRGPDRFLPSLRESELLPLSFHIYIARN